MRFRSTAAAARPHVRQAANRLIAIGPGGEASAAFEVSSAWDARTQRQVSTRFLPAGVPDGPDRAVLPVLFA